MNLGSALKICEAKCLCACADTEASGGFQHAPRGSRPHHATGLLDAQGEISCTSATAAVAPFAHGRSRDWGTKTEVRMHSIHDVYGPMHPRCPVEAACGTQPVAHRQSAPHKILDPSAPLAFESSMHEQECQQRERFPAPPQADERGMHGEHDCMHGEDGGSDSDDSYAWAQCKADMRMQSKGAWRGALMSASYACMWEGSATCHRMSQNRL